MLVPLTGKAMQCSDQRGSTLRQVEDKSHLEEVQMKVLLVGGSGNVGAFITPYLRQKHDIRVFDVRPPSHSDVEFVEGSVTDPDACQRALQGVDSFLWLVMKSPQGGTYTHQTLPVIVDNYTVNNLGLHVFLFTAAGLEVKRGVYTSTMSVHYRERKWYPDE